MNITALQTNSLHPTEERGAGADDAGGQLDQQRGVHGDGVGGLGPEGVERLVGTGDAAACGETPRRETRVVTDGVRDLSRGGHRDAVPADSERWSADLSADVVDPVARGIPASGGAVARLLVVLREELLKSGSGCPDPCWPSNPVRR